jgi:hypothetical protein
MRLKSRDAGIVAASAAGRVGSQCATKLEIQEKTNEL